MKGSWRAAEGCHGTWPGETMEGNTASISAGALGVMERSWGFTSRSRVKSMKEAQEKLSVKVQLSCGDPRILQMAKDISSNGGEPA